MELQGGVPLCPLRLLFHLLHGHPAALQFIHQIQKGLEKGRLPGGTTVHRQTAGHVHHGPLHHEELPAPVQGHGLQSPGLCQHPAGQPGEGEHLGVSGCLIPQKAAEVHLRRVGGLVRHQENLLPCRTVLRHQIQHHPGFSCVGPASDQPQHGRHRPFSCKFVSPVSYHMGGALPIKKHPRQRRGARQEKEARRFSTHSMDLKRTA